MQITAIILAGGKSKRMGTDKALLEVDGISLLEKAIALAEATCDHLIISSNHTEHLKYAYPVIADEVADCGPIGGIFSCLKRSKTDWNFVISVDAAFVEAEFIDYLKDQLDEEQAIVPFTKKGKEPLIAMYNKSCLSVLEEKIKGGEFKMQKLLDTLDTKFVNAQNWLNKYPRLFHNLNRPEDL